MLSIARLDSASSRYASRKHTGAACAVVCVSPPFESEAAAMNCRKSALPASSSHLDIERERSDAFLVRVHELSPNSPSFRPHPQSGHSGLAVTTARDDNDHYVKLSIGGDHLSWRGFPAAAIPLARRCKPDEILAIFPVPRHRPGFFRDPEWLKSMSTSKSFCITLSACSGRACP